MRVIYCLGSVGYFILAGDFGAMADGQDGLWHDVMCQFLAFSMLALAAFCVFMATKERRR